MTSDSRVVSLPLRKLECRQCGVCTASLDSGVFDSQSFYQEDYILAAAEGAGEPIFFSEGQRIPRSHLQASWLVDAVERWLRPKSVLEVGCGSGLLIGALPGYWPDASIVGIEPNGGAVEAARRRNVDVLHGTLADVRGKFDLIYSFAVLEHLEDPGAYFGLVDNLEEGGILVTMQPCQDVPSHDIYFVDHLFHFNSAHVSLLAERCGLEQVYVQVGHPLIPAFSLHIFRRALAAKSSIEIKFSSAVGGKELWEEKFTQVDRFLEASARKELVVWGLGEKFTLLKTYTDLAFRAIARGVDDNIGRAEARALTFSIDEFSENLLKQLREAAWLVTFKPSEHHRKLFEKHRVSFLSI